MKGYLRSSVGADQADAWAFPAFAARRAPTPGPRPARRSDDATTLLELAFDRYFETAASSAPPRTLPPDGRAAAGDRRRRDRLPDRLRRRRRPRCSPASSRSPRCCAAPARRARPPSEDGCSIAGADRAPARRHPPAVHAVDGAACWPPIRRRSPRSARSGSCCSAARRCRRRWPPSSGRRRRRDRATCTARPRPRSGRRPTGSASAGADGAGAVPIGRPIANTRLYVAGPGRPRRCRSASRASCFIGGDGVARGYWRPPGPDRRAVRPRSLRRGPRRAASTAPATCARCLPDGTARVPRPRSTTR